MDLRTRCIGALLVGCGLALCYGAVQLWPLSAGGSPTSSGAAGNLLRLAGALVVAVFGVGNVFAGLVVVMRRTARD